VRFLVVGDGGSKKELEEFASRLGLGRRIVFTGFRSDVPDLLSEVSISVLPSLSEGTSNTLLESMAAGIPVIATVWGQSGSRRRRGQRIAGAAAGFRRAGRSHGPPAGR